VNSEKTSRTGLSAELQLTAEAIDRGYAVLVPVGDFLYYDLIISNGSRHLKVQVKAANKHISRTNGQTYQRYTFTTTRHSGRYTSAQVDVFALYFKDIRKWAFVPFNAVTGTAIFFRKNVKGKKHGINKYEQYLDNWKIFDVKSRRIKK
jgi:hypothetical protein